MTAGNYGSRIGKGRTVQGIEKLQHINYTNWNQLGLQGHLAGTKIKVGTNLESRLAAFEVREHTAPLKVKRLSLMKESPR